MADYLFTYFNINHSDMSDKKDNIKSEQENKNKSSVQPEPETLHTTDPQENMKGPLSSLMHETGENFDSKKTPEQAEKEKDDKM
jgi:hypothetical protein